MRLFNDELLSEICEYITQYQATTGESPSQKKIADKLRLDNKKVFRYVHALSGKGLIELNDDGTIAIPYNLVPSATKHVPLLGAVRCGEPTLAIEEYDGVFKLPREFTGAGTFFMLRAKGDSMIDAGIYEGDYLVISEQNTAESGDIVVACRESGYTSEDAEATLKRYKYLNGKYVMHPENKAYKDMDASEFRIIGKLVSFIRKV